MADAHLDAELLVDMLGQVLGGIDRAVLTTGTAEAEHEGGEATLDITAHMGIGEFIDAVEEGEDLTIILQEADDGLVETGELLVRLVAAGVVGGTTVEHIATAIATLVLRDSLAIGEAEDLDYQGALSIVFREGGRTVLRVWLVGVVVCGLIAIGTLCSRSNLLELR